MDLHFSLATVCAPLRTALGWRRCRDLSIRIALLLKNKSDSITPEQIAYAISGVQPEMLMTADELQQKLSNHGIKLSRSKLYRLAKRTMSGRIEYWMNKTGQWDGPSSLSLEDPILAIEVVRDGRYTRFKVRELKQNSENRLS